VTALTRETNHLHFTKAALCKQNTGTLLLKLAENARLHCQSPGRLRRWPSPEANNHEGISELSLKRS
jgi:hypothetical protein